jgi:hypothetical protein
MGLVLMVSVGLGMIFLQDHEIFFEDAWLWCLDWSSISDAFTE